MKPKTLYITEPHGAQRLTLIEDNPNPELRIFTLSETTNLNDPDTIGFTGVELFNLAKWVIDYFWAEYVGKKK